MEKYFYEAFEGMQRLGPGCEDSTKQAAAYMENAHPIKILDIGCGIGTHAFIIAKELNNAVITCIDDNQGFIDLLNAKSKELNLEHRVHGICMSMFEMTFENSSFDYIYAEGAVYIAGFSKALTDWKKLLKSSGRIICSEISWTKQVISDEVKSFWEENYSQIDNITNKICQAENLGYEVIAHFALPKQAWTDNYYIPLAKNLQLMQKKHPNNTTALQVITMIQQEIDLYYKFSDEYTYVFYVLQKK